MTEKISDVPPKDSVRWLQWTVSTGAMLLLLVSGMMIGWTSPYIAKLTGKNSPLPITLVEASWVVSLLTLGRLFGAIPGAVLMSYIGGRKTLIILGMPILGTWVCIILADSVGWLYAARLMSGIALGATFSSFPLFLGEISSTRIRGTLVSFAISGLSLGILAGNVIGAYVSMQVFAYISLVPTLVSIAIFVLLPESPHHLIRSGRIDDATTAIVRYNPGVNVELEVTSLVDFISASDSVTFSDRLREFNIPENRKAGVIVIALFAYMQLSGVSTVLFYMETILINGGVTAIRPANMVIVAGTIGNLAGLLSIRLADKCGRRMLMMVSSWGVAASMLAIGAHFTLLESGFDPDKLQWLLISSLLGWDAFFFIGLCAVPSMVVSELFAPNIKSIAACIGSISLGLSSFVSSKTYQPLLDLIGTDYLFWLYAVIMMTSMLFALKVMPETKGKTLQEIQNNLHNKYTVVSKHDVVIEKNEKN